MNYADLKKKTQAATEQFHVLSAQIKSAEARMAEIAVLMDVLPAPNGADFGVWGVLPSTSISQVSMLLHCLPVSLRTDFRACTSLHFR